MGVQLPCDPCHFSQCDPVLYASDLCHSYDPVIHAYGPCHHYDPASMSRTPPERTQPTSGVISIISPISHSQRLLPTVHMCEVWLAS